jgi:hypothetical protein
LAEETLLFGFSKSSKFVSSFIPKTLDTVS